MSTNEVHSDKIMIITMKQLHDNTADIIRDINDNDKVAVITRNGRFIGKIEPLANIDNLEGKLLKRLIENGEISTVSEGGPPHFIDIDEIINN